MKRMRWNAIIDRVPTDRPVFGAEIGVLMANTSMRVLAARPNIEKHFMIDPWRVPEPDSTYVATGDENSAKSQDDHDHAYRVTVRRVAEFGPRAVIFRETSAEAAEKIPDGSLDYVFIDGDHSYEGVAQDIGLWLPKVRPGGWIGGHDYDHPRLPGVKRAVDQAFRQDQLEFDDNRTWFCSLD